MTNWVSLRKILIPYAYNILGSLEDSKDVIQNVFIKFNQKNDISNEKAYLIKAVINESINFRKNKSRSLQKKIWLPEPIVTNAGEKRLEQRDILQYSMLVLLETLHIKERAVFLLREVFEYSHTEISDALAITEENSRKLLSRAKLKLKNRKQTAPKATKANLNFLKKYISTIREGDVLTLENLLSQEIQVLADGGENLKVVAEFTSGISKTVELILSVYNDYQKDFKIIIGEVNHQSALYFFQGSTLINCQVFEVDEHQKITQIFSVIDPLKLKNLTILN